MEFFEPWTRKKYVFHSIWGAVFILTVVCSDYSLWISNTGIPRLVIEKAPNYGIWGLENEVHCSYLQIMWDSMLNCHTYSLALATISSISRHSSREPSDILYGQSARDCNAMIWHSLCLCMCRDLHVLSLSSSYADFCRHMPVPHCQQVAMSLDAQYVGLWMSTLLMFLPQQSLIHNL